MNKSKQKKNLDLKNISKALNIKKEELEIVIPIQNNRYGQSPDKTNDFISRNVGLLKITEMNQTQESNNSGKMQKNVNNKLTIIN